MTWIRQDGDAVMLVLHIQPGAKRSEIAGTHGDALKIRLAAPPVDGKANEALIAFLAAALGVAKASVDLVSGHGARAKRVRIAGMTVAAASERLRPEGQKL